MCKLRHPATESTSGLEHVSFFPLRWQLRRARVLPRGTIEHRSYDFKTAIDRRGGDTLRTPIGNETLERCVVYSV